MKVYGITGLPGSGKSIISRIAKNEGVHIVSMGDVVRKEAEQQNCPPGVAAVNLRKKYGNNVIADRCVKAIIQHNRARNTSNTTTKIYKTYHNNKKSHQKYRKVEQQVYIIEGIRSPFEVKYFKRSFTNFKVIAVHSNQYERFTRLKHRKRMDDSTDFKTFMERDKRELNFGIGDVIALADFMLINEGPIPKFKNTVRALILNEIKPKRSRYNRNNNKNQNKSNRKQKKGNKKYNEYNNKKSRNNNNRQRRRYY